MKKSVLIVILLLSVHVGSSFAQISMYDDLSYGASYKPFTMEEILAPAMILRQRHDANAEKIDKLVEYIYEVKNKTSETTLNNALDKRYKELVGLYDDKRGLAYLDREISAIKHSILKDVNEYNKRINTEKNKIKKSEPKEIKKSVRRDYSNDNKQQQKEMHLGKVFVSGNPYGIKYDDLISGLTKDGTLYKINLELEEYLEELGTTSVTFLLPALSSVTENKISAVVIMYFSNVNGVKTSFSNKVLYPLDEFKYVVARLNDHAEKVDNFKWKNADAVYAIDIEDDLFTVLTSSNFEGR